MRNYAKLGRRAACWWTVLVGFAVVAALVFGGDLLFSEETFFVRILINVPVWIGVYLAGRQLQGPAYEGHCQQGGGQTTGGVVLGFIVLGVVLTLGPVFVLEASLADHRLEVNRGEEVLYSKGSPKPRLVPWARC